MMMMAKIHNRFYHWSKVLSILSTYGILIHYLIFINNRHDAACMDIWRHTATWRGTDDVYLFYLIVQLSKIGSHSNSIASVG